MTVLDKVRETLSGKMDEIKKRNDGNDYPKVIKAGKCVGARGQAYAEYAEILRSVVDIRVSSGLSDKRKINAITASVLKEAGYEFSDTSDENKVIKRISQAFSDIKTRGKRGGREVTPGDYHKVPLKKSKPSVNDEFSLNINDMPDSYYSSSFDTLAGIVLDSRCGKGFAESVISSRSKPASRGRV